MIIDCILNRKDRAKDGNRYNPHDFYMDVLGYRNEWANEITEAMDYGEEEDVQTVLCEYIDRNEYNPLIKDYIRSVTWLTKTPLRTDIEAAIKFEVDTALAWQASTT